VKIILDLNWNILANQLYNQATLFHLFSKQQFFLAPVHHTADVNLVVQPSYNCNHIETNPMDQNSPVRHHVTISHHHHNYHQLSEALFTTPPKQQVHLNNTNKCATTPKGAAATATTSQERSPTLFEQAALFAQMHRQRNQTPSSMVDPSGLFFSVHDDDVIARHCFQDDDVILEASTSMQRRPTPILYDVISPSKKLILVNSDDNDDATQPAFLTLQPEPEPNNVCDTSATSDLDDVTPPLVDEQYLFALEEHEGLVDLFGGGDAFFGDLLMNTSE